MSTTTTTATVTSAARIAANRLNAQLSTGPRTAEGKERSRGNAVKHGLSGAGIALPAEDQAALSERFHSIEAELAPRTAVGLVLTHQVALASIRMERAAEQEAAALSLRVRHAATDFDEARHDEVDRLFAAIPSEPRRSYRKLLAMPEGVDRLRERLIGVKLDLMQPGVAWTVEHERLVETCCGRGPGAIPVSPVQIWSRAIQGDDALLRPNEIAQHPTAEARQAWAVRQMIAFIDDELVFLTEHRDTLDLALIERDRAEASARATFDPGREATLARRYEAAATRTFFRALRELAIVEAASEPTRIEPPPLTPPAPVRPAPVEPKGEPAQDLRDMVGSFGGFPRAAQPTTPAIPIQPAPMAENGELTDSTGANDRAERPA